MKEEHREVTIRSGWINPIFLPAIYNGDFSELNEEDSEAVKEWLDNIHDRDIVIDDYDPQFEVDEITDTLAACVPYRIVSII